MRRPGRQDGRGHRYRGSEVTGPAAEAADPGVAGPDAAGASAAWPVTLAPDTGRLPPYDGVPAAALARAGQLLARYPAISLHDHPVRLPDPLTAQTWQAWRADGREPLGYAGLASSGWAAVVASALSTGDLGLVLRWAAFLRADMRHHRAETVFAAGPGDIPAAGGGPVGILLGLEDLNPVGTDLGVLPRLFEAGIRCAGLTYNDGNPLGGGLASNPADTLTTLGRQAVRLMNDLGITVDVAHVGDRTALDACRVSRAPVVVSHAGARTVWPTPRMKPDAVLDAVADTGGVVAVSAAPNSTLSAAHPRHSLDSAMDHLTYLAGRLGVEHVALGPDAFFGDHIGLYEATGHRTTWATPPHEDIGYVAGLENPGEAARNVTAWLLDQGWSEPDIAGVIGGNVLRVLRATADVAAPVA
jgi:membrane dipeptidase